MSMFENVRATVFGKERENVYYLEALSFPRRWFLDEF